MKGFNSSLFKSLIPTHSASSKYKVLFTLSNKYFDELTRLNASQDKTYCSFKFLFHLSNVSKKPSPPSLIGKYSAIYLFLLTLFTIISPTSLELRVPLNESLITKIRFFPAAKKSLLKMSSFPYIRHQSLQKEDGYLLCSNS